MFVCVCVCVCVCLCVQNESKVAVGGRRELVRRKELGRC